MSKINPLSGNRWRLAAAGLEEPSTKALREAGLSNLLIDRRFDGEGAGFRDAAEALTGLGQLDASLAVTLASHYSATGLLRIHGDRDAVAVVSRHAANDWSLWSDLRLHPDTPVTIVPSDDGGARLNGITAPTHGVTEADTVVLTVPNPAGRARDADAAALVVVVPVDRQGLSIDEPVDRIGLRGSPAAAVAFDDVRVEPGELIAVAEAGPTLEGLRALFDAAVIGGAVHGSIERAAELTRARKIPRPVPGVKAATADPLSQTAIGAGLFESAGAIGTTLRAAGEFDDLAGDGEPAPDRTERARLRALAANEVAVTIGLSQGKNVFEVVGTSGSANKHGFDRLWRDSRVLASRHPRTGRQRAVGAAFLDRSGIPASGVAA